MYNVMMKAKADSGIRVGNGKLIKLLWDYQKVVKTSLYQTFPLLSAALALQFLRTKGIAHMDLKPQNLLLTGGGGRKTVLKLAGTSVFALRCVTAE